MNQEQKEIDYDQFMPLFLQERIRIFNEVSAENRALLVRTQVERWLAFNRSQLDQKQIDLLNEIIPLISSEKYEENRDVEKVEREADKITERLESVFSRDQIRQMATNRADYIPPIENAKDIE